MDVLLWTRCWTCSLYLERMLINSKRRVTCIAHESGLDKTKLYAYSHIYMYWPRFELQDYHLCLTLRNFTTAPIFVISSLYDLPDDRRIHDREIYFLNETDLFASCSGEDVLLPLRDLPIHINPSARSVIIDDREIELSDREFAVFEYLYSRINTVVGREELISRLWNGIASDSNVYITIQKLRRKIESDPSRPKRLLTRKGGGYMLKSAMAGNGDRTVELGRIKPFGNEA